MDEEPEKYFLVDRLCMICTNFSNELNQNFPFSFDIINQILNSKLLLVDHVEIIEEALADLEVKLPNSKFLTYSSLSALAATTLFVRHLWPSSGLRIINLMLPAAVGAYGFLYSYKTIFRVRNKFLARRFQKLLKTLNKYTMAIKRNINYFNEIQFMQPKSDSIEPLENNERAWNCIESIKTVIIVLFNRTRMLEANYPLTGKVLDYYSPMEELQDCDYFTKPVTDFNPKKIKDFYNILAYVTSQFLLRVALTATNECAIKAIQSNISKLTDVIHKQENFLKLKYRTKEVAPGDSIKFDEAPVRSTNLGLTTLLTETSLRFNSCIVAVADECQKLDETFNNIADDHDEAFSFPNISNKKDTLIETAAHMRNIETSLSNCSDDFHRLMLIYNKLLNALLKVDIGFMPNAEKIKDHNDSIQDDAINLLVSVDEPIDQDVSADDFYAYMFDENVNIKTKSANIPSTADSELNNFEVKISRKKFKPVLSQLKEKINPIKENMLQKERAVLKAKGIDIDKLFEEENDSRTEKYPNDEDSFDSDSDEVKPRKPKRDYYEEDRNFLAQKQAVNIFKLQLPTPIAGEEDILE